MRARARPRGGTGRSRPATSSSVEPLDRAVVEVDVGERGRAEVGLPAHRLVGLDVPRRRRAPRTAKPWFCEVISIRPVAQVLDRVVGAAVAERAACRSPGRPPGTAAGGRGRCRTPAACRRARAPCRRRSRARPGRRGRWRGRSRRGRSASSSSALAVHGCSSTRAPRATRLRTIEPLIPVSIAAIRGPVAVAVRRSARAGVTSRARSRPAIGGSAAITLARLGLGSSRAGKTPPRIAPASRMWRTSARVSTPVIAGTPQSAQPVQPAALGARARPRG